MNAGWIVNRRSHDLRADEVRWHITDGEGRDAEPIAFVVETGSLDSEDTQALRRACLIAAAPELLDALLACVEPVSPGEDCPLPTALYNRVCAAIAKATGSAS